MKIYLPSTFILRYVKAKMIVHEFIIEFDQTDYMYWYPRKIAQLWKSMYKVNGDLFSRGYHRFWQSSLQRGRHTQLCIISSLKWIIQICSKFYCWVSKIAFHSPNPHWVFGETSPLSIWALQLFQHFVLYYMYIILLHLLNLCFFCIFLVKQLASQGNSCPHNTQNDSTDGKRAEEPICMAKTSAAFTNKQNTL